MAPDSRPPVALIAGPTASGKSALALALAEAANGVIVNADSAQVYADLPILSAAPSAADRVRADHRLYGVADGAEAMSAAAWADLAKSEIAGIHDEGKLPILVGGTGLYLRTLIDGISPIPDIDPAVRAQVRAASVIDNRRLLFQHDFETASKLGPADTARIARALEVVLSTGRRLSEWHLYRSGGIGEQVDLRPLILLPPREWLYARCDTRFEAMVEEGAVDEVRHLLTRGLSEDLPVMRAIGVRELAGFIEGKETIEEAVARGQQATRNYAKRQYTWFANQPPVYWLRFTDRLDEAAIPAALDVIGADALAA